VFVLTSVLAGLVVVADAASAASKPRLALTSSAFTNDATMPDANTCKGAGVSPPLAWRNVPKGTKHLALIMEDPDAPSGRFVHWVVAGIEPKPPSIAEGATPSGALEGLNSLGRRGWVPPCPPAGPAHDYVFTLYALAKSVALNSVPPTASQLREAMKGKVVGRAKLVGRYGT
jgi:Raf kinase inhibitor-like YbhB/YbcL family protein